MSRLETLSRRSGSLWVTFEAFLVLVFSAIGTAGDCSVGSEFLTLGLTEDGFCPQPVNPRAMATKAIRPMNRLAFMRMQPPQIQESKMDDEAREVWRDRSK